jgi:hypothetical protein
MDIGSRSVVSKVGMQKSSYWLDCLIESWFTRGAGGWLNYSDSVINTTDTDGCCGPCTFSLLHPRMRRSIWYLSHPCDMDVVEKERNDGVFNSTSSTPLQLAQRINDGGRCRTIAGIRSNEYGAQALHKHNTQSNRSISCKSQETDGIQQIIIPLHLAAVLWHNLQWLCQVSLPNLND